MRNKICELCEIGEKSYYVWKNKSHKKLINLLEKYFTKEDLEEFLEQGYVSKLENNENIKKFEEKLKSDVLNKLHELSIWDEFTLIDFINIHKNEIIENEYELIKVLEEKGFISFYNKDKTQQNFEDHFFYDKDFKSKIQFIVEDLNQKLTSKNIEQPLLDENGEISEINARKIIDFSRKLIKCLSNVNNFSNTELYYLIQNIEFFNTRNKNEYRFLIYHFENEISEITIKPL